MFSLCGFALIGLDISKEAVVFIIFFFTETDQNWQFMAHRADDLALSELDLEPSAAVIILQQFLMDLRKLSLWLSEAQRQCRNAEAEPTKWRKWSLAV